MKCRIALVCFLVLMFLGLTGCSSSYDSGMLETLNKDEVGNNNAIKLAFEEFEDKYKQVYTSQLGEGSYQLGTPLTVYHFNKENLKTFSAEKTIRSQMKKSTAILFPVIRNNKIVQDYRVEIIDGELSFIQPPDLKAVSKQRQVIINEPQTAVISSILEYNKCKADETYLVQMPYGPNVLCIEKNGQELSVPLDLAQKESFYTMSDTSTIEIKKRLLLAQERYEDPGTFEPQTPGAPAFNAFEITDIWIGLNEEIIKQVQ